MSQPISPPAGKSLPDFSRRTVLVGGATSVALGTIIAVADVQPSNAAITWGHPFKTRISPSRHWGGSYPEYYPSPGPHRGIDYPYGLGTDVHAVASGVVAFAGTKTSQEWAWAGKHVLIVHASGHRSLYAHMSSLNVATNESVSLHAKVGEVGSTGGNWGNHLHLEIWTGANRYSDSIDPYPLIHNAKLPGGAAEQDGEVQLQALAVTGDRTTKQSIAPNTEHWLLFGDEGRLAVANGPAKAVSGVLTVEFSTTSSSGSLRISPLRVDVNSAGDVTDEVSLWASQIPVLTPTTAGKIPVEVELLTGQLLRFKVTTTGGMTAKIEKVNFRGSRFLV
ncbi:M23 family metallopeptidase [Microbacterium sp. LMI1x-1-1.1]|uniref:M23 family metallopeptidase n=1 Tax=Microbacterium sp. LMI1x-1-1.1 TaxID=3135246 RepID=UPI00343D78B5